MKDPSVGPPNAVTLADCCFQPLANELSFEDSLEVSLADCCFEPLANELSFEDSSSLAPANVVILEACSVQPPATEVTLESSCFAFVAAVGVKKQKYACSVCFVDVLQKFAKRHKSVNMCLMRLNT